METGSQEIGRLIREERKKKGLTQAVVAKNAGIAVNSLRLYEAGKRCPNLDQLKKIAKALDVDAFSLMDFDTASDALSDMINTPAKQLILTAFDQLNDDGQQKAVERVEELTEIPKYKKEPPQG